MYLHGIRRIFKNTVGVYGTPIAMYVTFTVIPYYGHGINNYVNFFYDRYCTIHVCTCTATFGSLCTYVHAHVHCKQIFSSQGLLYDVHFWIGQYSSQDEYGTAAYKTVELDSLVWCELFGYEDTCVCTCICEILPQSSRI